MTAGPRRSPPLGHVYTLAECTTWYDIVTSPVIASSWTTSQKKYRGGHECHDILTSCTEGVVSVRYFATSSMRVAYGLAGW